MKSMNGESNARHGTSSIGESMNCGVVVETAWSPGENGRALRWQGGYRNYGDAEDARESGSAKIPAEEDMREEGRLEGKELECARMKCKDTSNWIFFWHGITTILIFEGVPWNRFHNKWELHIRLNLYFIWKTKGSMDIPELHVAHHKCTEYSKNLKKFLTCYLHHKPFSRVKMTLHHCFDIY